MFSRRPVHRHNRGRYGVTLGSGSGPAKPTLDSVGSDVDWWFVGQEITWSATTTDEPDEVQLRDATNGALLDTDSTGTTSWGGTYTVAVAATQEINVIVRSVKDGQSTDSDPIAVRVHSEPFEVLHVAESGSLTLNGTPAATAVDGLMGNITWSPSGSPVPYTATNSAFDDQASLGDVSLTNNRLDSDSTVDWTDSGVAYCVIVGRSQASGNNHRMLEHGDTAGGGPGNGFSLVMRSGVDTWLGKLLGNVGASIEEATGYTLTDAQILELDADKSRASNEMQLYVGGVRAGTVLDNDNNTTLAFSNATLSIGGSLNGTDGVEYTFAAFYKTKPSGAAIAFLLASLETLYSVPLS